jgi:crotonobetainyl-CoA:carnitine CoA-transferase CaiB-like acyl-CoA transferase
VIDVSLMSIGAWAMALSVSTALLSGEMNSQPPLTDPPYIPVNPTIGNYQTSDGRFITLMMLQPGRYFADVCKHLGLDELLSDERFATAEGVMTHTEEIGRRVAEAIGARPYAYWVDRLQTLEGPWSPVQNPLELAHDPQVRANGYVVPVTDADGIERHLVANPVQFDETPPTLVRGPQFAEHTDEILGELGKSEDEIIELKVEGACT